MNSSDFERPEIHRGRPKKEVQEPTPTPIVEEPVVEAIPEKFPTVKCKYVGPEQHQYAIKDGSKLYVFRAPDYTCNVEKKFAKTLDEGIWPVKIV